MQVIVDIDDDLYTRLFDNGVDNYDDAVDMAKAIRKGTPQQPCEDCISRQATIDAIYKKHIGGKEAVENAPLNDLYACGLEEAVDAVENMPPVTPTIPDVENNYDIGYNCGYADAMFDIAEGSEDE